MAPDLLCCAAAAAAAAAVIDATLEGGIALVAAAAGVFGCAPAGAARAGGGEGTTVAMFPVCAGAGTAGLGKTAGGAGGGAGGCAGGGAACERRRAQSASAPRSEPRVSGRRGAGRGTPLAYLRMNGDAGGRRIKRRCHLCLIRHAGLVCPRRSLGRLVHLACLAALLTVTATDP